MQTLVKIGSKINKKTIFEQLIPFVNNIYYKRAKKSLILTYHRVYELDYDPYALTVHPRIFEIQMKYLRENYNIIPLSELISQLKEKKIKEDSVIITFDDGYHDNLYNSKPILKKYDIPATFFISAGMIGGKKEFWWDELERIFLTRHTLTYKPLELNINGKKYR